MEAMKTRGQIEAAITEAIIQFERGFMGRGSLEARSHLLALPPTAPIIFIPPVRHSSLVV